MKLRLLLVIPALAAGCMDKVEPGKGEIDTELPPGSPNGAPTEGKSDSGGIVVGISVESPHPYTNNLDLAFPVDLAGRVPDCASSARVHLASLRTEAGYDYLHVETAAGVQQSFDGNRDDLWSDWFDLGADKRFTLRLETDYSITRDGFVADAVETFPRVLCPLVVLHGCTGDTFDVNPSTPVCECPRDGTCVAASTVMFEHTIGGGFSGLVGGHRLVGTTAYSVTYKPGDPDQVTEIGSVDRDRVQTVLRQAIDAGLPTRPDHSEPSNWNEALVVSVDGDEHRDLRPQGSYPADDAAFIADLDALFRCDAGGALTCGAGFTCDDGECVADAGCVCPAVYEPVCGANGQTYSNACAAGCAQAPVRHPGECGIAGDPCGGLLGWACQGDLRCRYAESTFEAPYPDASGACVAADYCDAPPDCAGLFHPAVPGEWACQANACRWQQGLGWRDFASFATPHPYANQQSVWKQLYAPEGAGRVRLVVDRFDLEANYDFLEVYTWRNGRWNLDHRYTGRAGPTLSDELVGRYHYLRFVSDVSVVRDGFELSAQWAY